MKYFNLHSNFSPLGGLASPEALINKVLSCGHREMALTDTNGFYGIPEFLKLSNEKNIKGVIGCEVRSLSYQFIILVKSRLGYQAVCEFLTLWHKYDYEGRELAFNIGCEVLKAVSREIKIIAYDKKLLSYLAKLGFENVFFEMSEDFFNHYDYLWAKKHNLKCVMNNKVHYLENKESLEYQVLRSIAKNSSLLENHNIEFHHPSCFFKTPEYFYKKYAHYTDALKESEHILDDCESDWFFEGLVSPGFHGLTEKECSKKLKDLCLASIPIRYSGDKVLQQQAIDRLDYEMDIIQFKHFSSYFLNVRDIVANCEYTCGRGSSAASLVNYLLEITHVDPIKENLLLIAL